MTITQRKRLHSPHQPVGRWITTKRRLAIYLRDAFRCLLCLGDLRGRPPRDISLDHILPRGKGGGNESANLYTCCRACNSARYDQSIRAVAGPRALARVRASCALDMAGYIALAGALVSSSASWGDAMSGAASVGYSAGKSPGACVGHGHRKPSPACWGGPGSVGNSDL